LSHAPFADLGVGNAQGYLWLDGKRIVNFPISGNRTAGWSTVT